MAENEIDVKYVAHLARISLSPAEEQKIGAQLGNILGYIEKLKQLDVSQVEPTAHAVPLVNVTRADEIHPAKCAGPGQRAVPRPQNRRVSRFPALRLPASC
jgi:aspartyl-tRNA(Asn)/glutamyl-tRNA(Gln) amidotransferase subunit C